MWVKIKSKKINNEILEVPYSAFLNTYSKKGYVIVEDKNAKNEAVNTVNTTQKEVTINEEKEEVLDYKKVLEQINSNNSNEENIKLEQDEKPKLSGNRGVKDGIPQREPIKKSTVSKR